MRPPLDEARLRQIYRETVDALYAYVSRRCGGVREVAEDITQETWLRAVRDWTRNGIPDVPLAWLTTVSRNLMLNQARRPDAFDLDAVSAEDLLGTTDHDTLESAEIASVVTEALDRLPEAEAKLLRAFHYDRIKVAEIARAYGISERAVEGRLRRARQRLRHELAITLKSEGGIP